MEEGYRVAVPEEGEEGDRVGHAVRHHVLFP